MAVRGDVQPIGNQLAIHQRSVSIAPHQVRGDVRRVTDPKQDLKKAKHDEVIVDSDAVLNRRQKKKEKSFAYSMR